jgi:replicative DNA helicase
MKPSDAVKASSMLIGECLVVPEKILPSLMESLKPEDFLDFRHQELFRAILRLKQRGDTICYLSVCREIEPAILRRMGGPAFIAGLPNNFPMSKGIL